MGGPDREKPAVIQQPTEHWLVTEEGLEHVEPRLAAFTRGDAIAAGPTPPPDTRPGAPDAAELERAWAVAHARFIE